MKKFVLTSTAKADIRGILNFLKSESPAGFVRVLHGMRDVRRLLEE